MGHITHGHPQGEAPVGQEADEGTRENMGENLCYSAHGMGRIWKSRASSRVLASLGHFTRLRIVLCLVAG